MVGEGLGFINCFWGVGDLVLRVSGLGFRIWEFGHFGFTEPCIGLKLRVLGVKEP